MNFVSEWMDNGTLLEYLPRVGRSCETLCMVRFHSANDPNIVFTDGKLGIWDHIRLVVSPQYEHSSCRSEKRMPVVLLGTAAALMGLWFMQPDVFISNQGSPLLADFGLSRMLSNGTIAMCISTYKGTGSVRWMAAELLDIGTVDEWGPDSEFPSESEYNDIIQPSAKSDVWVLGMVIYVRLISLGCLISFYTRTKRSFN